MNGKAGFIFLLILGTAASLGSGCQSNSPIAQRVTQIKRQYHLVPTPISSHEMSGSIGESRSVALRPRTIGPPPQMLHQMPKSLQTQFARMQQNSTSLTPGVKAALRTAEADAQVDKQLGQKLELRGKYSFQQERFQSGASTTEFEYGVQGDRGHGTMTGKTVINQAKTATESLVIRPASGGTIVLK